MAPVPGGAVVPMAESSPSPSPAPLLSHPSPWLTSGRLLAIVSGILISSLVIIVIIVWVVLRKCCKSRKLPILARDQNIEFPHDCKDKRQVGGEIQSEIRSEIQSSTSVVRERKHAFLRGKEMGVMVYLNRVLRLIFTVFGILTIILSVVLDNSYNDRPVRFIPFGVLAPFTIFFGFLASGWFPRIPLRFIASLKGYGFLRYVMPCSPWHDNVLTDYSGMICTLKPMEQAEGTSQLPSLLRNFIYGDQGYSQDSQLPSLPEKEFYGDQGYSQDTAITESELEPESSDIQEIATVDQESQDLSIQDSEDVSDETECPPMLMTTGQAPSQAEETVVQIDHSPMFCVFDHGCILTFEGPTINDFPLKVQVFKDTSLRDSFDLSYTFRNMKTRRMYLNTRRLHNLAHNMRRWLETPHPIVVNESSDILHCMSIQDILWTFTKFLYTLESLHVQHRCLGCLSWEGVRQYALMIFIAVTSLSGLIPLISDIRSLYFLFLVVPIVAYIFISVTGHLITYYFRALLCPMFIRVRGFNELYKCRSFFIWCNEFRKQRVVNPAYFLIDQEYANDILENGESCFDVHGSVKIPDNPPRDLSPITLTCQGRPVVGQENGPRQHDYRLRVTFDNVVEGCYINVILSFYENDDLLGNRYFFCSIQAERLHLVEKLFNYYSDPSFGGYVESIRPSYWLYLGYCPRFLDVCKKIISNDPTPTLLIAARRPGSKLIIG